MSDDNNGKKSLGDAFDKLMKGRTLTLVDQLKRLSDEALPVVSQFRASGGDFMAAMGAEMAHGMLRQLDPVILMEATMQIRDAAADRNQVRATVAEIMTGALDPVKAQSAAESGKELVLQMTKAEFRTLNLALRDLVPNRMKAFYDEVQGVTPANLIQKIDESYDNAVNKSVAELAAEAQARAARFPIDAVTDKLIAAAAGVTPAKITTLADTFAKAVTGTDFANLAGSGLAFAEEFLVYAAAEKPFSTQYSADAASFGPALKKALQGIEDAAVASGILPDLSDLKPAMKAYYTPAQNGPRRPQGPAV